MLPFISKYFLNQLINNWRTVIALCASAGLSTVIHFKIVKPYLVSVRIEGKKALGVDMLKINQLILFGAHKERCNCKFDVLKNCQNFNCCHGALRYILNLIDNAKSTMEIAIYVFSHAKIGNAIKDAHRRGVNVRIISDCDMSFSGSSLIPELRNIDSEFLATGLWEWATKLQDPLFPMRPPLSDANDQAIANIPVDMLERVERNFKTRVDQVYH